MMKKHLRFVLVSVVVALTAGALVAAKGGQKPGGHLRVTEVFVDFNTQSIEITGEDFDFGPGPLTVSLGEFGDISALCLVDFTPPQLISCDLSAGGLPSDGDYLLTVANGNGQSQSDQYDLTIGAVGPQGPAGPPGVVSFPVNNTKGGTNALVNNTSGSENSAFGVNALQSNTTGNENTAMGKDALRNNTTGVFNTAMGSGALQTSTTACCNTAIGQEALATTTTGVFNTASGAFALQFNTTGFHNTASGEGALNSNTTGTNNTASGRSALRNNTTGSKNIALGVSAGTNATTGNDNIYIGNTGVAGEATTIKIGTSGTQTKTFIAGISGIITGGAAVPVLVDGSGQLGTVSSSRRYKEEIEDMGEQSSGLMQLRPVTFRYTKAYANGDRPVQPGLIAEEVFQVFPDLVVHDRSGEIETVQYQKLIPILLNELQKQEKQMAELKQRLELLETDRVPKIVEMN